MDNNISIIKGIHPGIVLGRELKKRKLAKGRFALSINEYPQTIGAITKVKRDMNTSLAMKIEQELGLEEGYFMVLQVYYDIKKIKQLKQINKKPDLSIIRPVLFWDTTIANIDWEKQKRSVIKRVFERGNEQEMNEIIRFYGRQTVEEIRQKIAIDKNTHLSTHIFK
ncbi:plasmid maintenance system antidote protein [Mucilaginibacter sp.]|uniref:helix-turn-helix transcriptional regulator n=1 Tax=Mucilaginibacter sp. TaxID=1882438 RepID=UPI002632EC8A|nr:plasmid maintenance system antidote protein [Mucilaginibacter sp.]MDB5030163.1 plasmid maintenance system antidote protein [Mucilaginibacter sp.]